MQPLHPYFPEVGFSTNVLDNPADFVKTIDDLSKNFSYIEFEMEGDAEKAILQLSPDEYFFKVNALKSIIDRKNATLTVHAPYVGKDANLASADDAILSASIKRLKRAVRLASDVGSTKVTFHPGFNRASKAELKDRLLRVMDAVVPYASNLGVQLCMENMGADRPNYIVFSAKEHEEICAKTGVAVTLDVIHLMSICKNDSEFWEELDVYSKIIRNMHVADMNKPKHIHIPVGEGNLELAMILNFVAERGYRGGAVVEEFGGKYKTEVFIQNAIAFKHAVDQRRNISQRAA